jgi:hypothetical protein
MRNISDTVCRENQNTHFVFSIYFFENLAIYEIIKNISQSEPGHRWKYGACVLHVGYLRPHSHTQIVYRTVALGSTQPLTEMSTRSISWG